MRLGASGIDLYLPGVENIGRNGAHERNAAQDHASLHGDCEEVGELRIVKSQRRVDLQLGGGRYAG